MTSFYPIETVAPSLCFVSDEERPMGELWLVRHGETEWSATGRHTSHTDVPLTENGVARAGALAARLRDIGFDRVLTSPASRAQQTCALAGFGSRAEVFYDLREWDYGTGEGLTTAEIRETTPGWTVWTHELPGSERAVDVGARADRVIATARASSGRVLAFSHGHMSRVIGARWIELVVADGVRLALDTAAVSVLGWERDRPVLRRWNDTGTLAP
jgi:broad specificity phosphatase PhoE